MKRILVIDNYDSFTFNLVQELGRLGTSPTVYRNDAISVAAAIEMAADGIVISPGPCDPSSAGISLELIHAAAGRIPVLGVCLGHQAIGHAFGGRVVRNAEVMHGKASAVSHRRAGVFRHLPSPFQAGRYHSLVIDPSTLPHCLRVTAWTSKNEIMGIKHRRYDIEGVQFHPESVLTPEGRTLIQTWVNRLTGEHP
jgi:anthranilate synthase component II